MARTHTIQANGTRFHAQTGQVILDSALMNGVEFPHDCRAGRCGSCLTRVKRGLTIGGETLQRGMVHACQAQALSDLDLEFDVLPPPQSVAGTVASLVPRSRDVIEVHLNLNAPINPIAGQYCTFQFRGYPARSFSPTRPADGSRPGKDHGAAHQEGA